MPKFRKPGNTAVITGGASGIGLVVAQRLVADGMSVLIADLNEEALELACSDLKALNAGQVFARKCDVSSMDDMETLRDKAFETLGRVNFLFNNAGIIAPPCAPWENLEGLHKTLEVNLMGVVHGCHAFIPKMLESGADGVIVNTGSKQGITRPPGSYIYNLSKAGVLAYSEAVAHSLREIDGGRLSAHLLVPGFVYTPMISKFIPDKPAFAWTAEETVDFALPRIENDEFYVICPDNESPREVDEKRMQWTADDLIKNRPALSRWHPDFKDAFDEHMQSF